MAEMSASERAAKEEAKAKEAAARLLEAKRRLQAEADYVHLPRYQNSVRAVVERYPEGAPDELIAAGLLISIEEVERLYRSAVEKIRASMLPGT